VTWLSWSLLILLSILLMIGMVTDVRARILPNWLTLSVGALAPLYWYAEGLAVWPDISVRLALSALCFLIFAVVYARGGMGGGDVKLISALALWMAPATLMQFLIAMSLFGGALGLLSWVYAHKRKTGEMIEVPYGVAISLGTFWVIPELVSSLSLTASL
jgi:prepilin peptidase CpaA